MEFFKALIKILIILAEAFLIIVEIPVVYMVCILITLYRSIEDRQFYVPNFIEITSDIIDGIKLTFEDIRV